MDKYKSIIDDWRAFKQQSQKHPITTVRRNPIKAPDDFEEKLKQRFPKAEQTGWNPEVYRIKGEKSPGKSMLYWLGDYYVQEESASLPVEVLQPEKGETVLDMCAAPGGKTTQIAAEIDNKGVIIANDDNAGRIRSLHANVYRTGSYCVKSMQKDGRQIPGREKYDRILLDAPCSGEGDRYYRNFEAAEPGESGNLSTLQKQLGEAAARLLKKGGEIVYSTCTFNPRENEEVVSHLAENTDLEILEIGTECPHIKGVESFEDREFHPDVSKTVRVYPHHINSGGIYVARLGKKG